MPDAETILENTIDKVFLLGTSYARGRIRHIIYNTRVGWQLVTGSSENTERARKPDSIVNNDSPEELLSMLGPEG